MQPHPDDSRRNWLAARQLTYAQRIIVEGAHSHAEWQANVDDVRRDEVANRIRQATSVGLLPAEHGRVLLDRIAAKEDPGTLERSLAAAGVPEVCAPNQPLPTPPTRATNGLAIASLICAFLLAPAGIVFGHLALRQIKATGEGGRALAITGLALGYVFTVVGILAVAAIVMFAAAWSDYLSHCEQSTCVM